MLRPGNTFPLLTILALLLEVTSGCSKSGPEDPAVAVARTEEGRAPGAGGSTAAGPKHVLLVVIDTLRADHLSCYGYWRETSPNIDAMARRGVRFERAISQSSWTSPSMITLMTGQRLSRRRLNLPEDRPTLAELFKDAGYRTGAFVSNPLLSHKNGFNRGFDSWMSSPLREVGPVVEWLEETAADDTFTWVHFTDPHDPYLPPRKMRSQILGRISEEQSALLDLAGGRSEEPGTLAEQRAHIAREVGLYDDEIVSVDRKVRELLVALQRAGNLERAIVVLTSDHGETLWERLESDYLVEHQRQQRGTPTELQHLLKKTHGEYVYQELVRVPLIIMAPQLTPGAIESSVAESVNLAPTVLSLAGVTVQGVELLIGKNLFGEDVPPGAYTMTNQGEAFVSEDGWKLILPTAEGQLSYGQVIQLYDLRADPGERRNLAAAEPERVAQLKRRIEDRRATAIALQDGPDWEEQSRANARALRDLGYVDGGLIELEEESDPPPQPESSAGVQDQPVPEQEDGL